MGEQGDDIRKKQRMRETVDRGVVSKGTRQPMYETNVSVAGGNWTKGCEGETRMGCERKKSGCRSTARSLRRAVLRRSGQLTSPRGSCENGHKRHGDLSRMWEGCPILGLLFYDE